MKTVDFSETIAASDRKGSRSRHLIRRYVIFQKLLQPVTGKVVGADILLEGM